jgi:photosystem II stability/assembly factor-like uncharacterized protein
MFYGSVFTNTAKAAISIESLSIGGGGFICDIAVAPSSPNIVYTASDLGGMYKSTNYGDNWTIINKGLVTDADFAVCSIAIDPQNADVVYIGSGLIWGDPTGNYGGIFKTVNGGADWELVTRKVKFSAMGTYDVEGRLIAVDPTNGNIVYAGSHRDGIFKSTDGGANWSLIGLAGKYISSVVVDPTNTDTIYVSSQIAEAYPFTKIPPKVTPGIYKSTDGGNTWQTLTTDYNVYDLTIDAQNPQILYVAAFNQGVFKSTDGGGSWTSKTPAADVNYVSIAASPTNPQIVYAKGNSVNQVYKTTNGGTSWQKITSNLNDKGWYFGSSKFAGSDSGITVDPTDPKRVYVGDDHGLWRSDNGGSSWNVKPYGLETSCAQASAINPQAPNEIYSLYADIGLHKSVDSGATWTRISALEGNAWAIAIDASVSPITVYVGTGKWSGSTAGGKIYKSTNNGSTWTALGTSNGLTDSRIRSIAIDPTNPSIIYSGHTNGTIYKSCNKGTSWERKSSGIPSGNILEVLTIAINPSCPNTLYAVVRDKGIYKSTNGGDSWSESNHGIGTTDLWDVAIDPNSPNTVYAVATSSGIFRSTNAGADWNNVHSNYDGLSLAIDSNSVIYAGGKAYWSSSTVPGLYRSTNGTTWTRIDDGRFSIGIDSIEIDPTNNNRLYISSRGNGTFRVDVDAAPDSTPPE